MDETKDLTVLTAEKQCRKSYSKIAVLLTVAYVLAMGTAMLINSFLVPVLAGITDDTVTLKTVVSFLPMYIVCFPILIFTVGKMEKTDLPHTKLGGKRLFVLFSLIFPIMISGSLIGTFLSVVLSGGKAENDLAGLLSSMNPLTIIVATFIGPFFEEIVFRKIIIDRTVRYGEKAAILFSAFCFGLFHMNLYQFFYAFGIGLILGYIYVRSGDVRITIVFHVIINSLSSIVIPFLLEKADITKFSELMENNEMTESFLIENSAFFQEHMIWFVLYMVYILIYFGMIFFGIAMFIVNRKKLEIHYHEGQLPDKTGIKESFVNIGMGIYFFVSVILIGLSLVSAG